jgi:exopolysaccharide production protein ExoY
MSVRVGQRQHGRWLWGNAFFSSLFWKDGLQSSAIVLSPFNPAAPLSGNETVGTVRQIGQAVVADATRFEVPIGGWLKRAADVVIATVALLVFAPFMLAIGLLIRLWTGGPAIFAQERAGFDGSTFTCYKFRTMVMNAEEALNRHLASDPAAAKEWRETRKLRHDPRVGCIGNVLRKSSLDELPQLINVIRGEMSIVGPRPVVPGELSCYGRHAKSCFMAKPGVTGMWQVSGRNRLSYSARVALDRYYARNWSIWLDVWILFKTVGAVLRTHDTA